MEVLSVVPPGNRIFAIVKRDQFTYYWGWKVRPSAPNPAVDRTGDIEDHKDFERSPLTKKWQHFFADCLAVQKYGKLYALLTGDPKRYIKAAFNGITRSDRAFTNGRGTDNCNNYITNTMRGQDPMIDPLICAGSIVEILEVKTNSRGLIMARLATFKATETPPIVTAELLKNDPRILTATIINTKGELSHFPQLAGMRNPYPYISTGDVWFPLRDLDLITA